MKFRRLTASAMDGLEDLLNQQLEKDTLDLTSYLEDDANAELMEELADTEFDPNKQFEHAYDAAEYFYGILSTAINPALLLKDANFWTWLALVYLPQLVSVSKGKKTFGEIAHIRFFPDDWTSYYRHYLAGPFYVYYAYRNNPQVCKAVLWNKPNVRGDVREQFMARQRIVQNPAFMAVINRLYFDEEKQRNKKGAGGKDGGSPRRFAVAVDQFGLTKDFFEPEDAERFLEILPKEFNRFNPLREAEWREERKAQKKQARLEKEQREKKLQAKKKAKRKKRH